MKKHSKAIRFAASLFAVALVASACGGSDDEATEDTTAEETAAEAASYPTLEQCGEVSYDYTQPASAGGMTVTYDINPDAVWDDGSPITAADFKATWEASLNTPGSVVTGGYDQIVSVEAGSSDKQVVVDFKTVYGPWRLLFSGLLKASALENPSDISTLFQDTLPFSARPWKMKSWSPEQAVFVPNENYWGEDKPAEKELVMVGFADSDTELAAIKAGEVDFIYPQKFGGIDEALADPNIETKTAFGSDVEAFYFQSKCGPFADPVYREAFSKSIDREAILQQIYVPLGADSLLQCGPIAPGPFCAENAWANSYDPEGAKQLLEDNGWSLNADGFWADANGNVPEVRWVINIGNTRRENTQAYLIPLLTKAGFNVRTDNSEREIVFGKRLPGMDFDMAMYISTAYSDPGYLTSSFACDKIPTTANNNVGGNNTGWCSKEASDLLYQADAETDPAKRAALVKEALVVMETGKFMLPLIQFPILGAWRTDKVGGPVKDDIGNFMAFGNNHLWTDTDGDGKVVIGAEQWAACLNPVTECATSSWMVWTTINQVLPGAFFTKTDGSFYATNLLAKEPTVVIN